MTELARSPFDAAPPDQVDPEVAVAEALAGLDELADRPPAEHVEAFERLHAVLSSTLAAGSA